MPHATSDVFTKLPTPRSPLALARQRASAVRGPRPARDCSAYADRRVWHSVLHQALKRRSRSPLALVVSRMNNVRKCLDIFTLVPLYALKRCCLQAQRDFFLMKTLFDEIISKKLHNTPSGITARIDLKSALHNPTAPWGRRGASPAGAVGTTFWSALAEGLPRQYCKRLEINASMMTRHN